MNESAQQTNAAPATTPAPAAPTAAPKRAAHGLTRVVVVIVILLITAAALVVLVPWSRYRYGHIVLNDAVVKGTITKIGGRLDGRVQSISVEPGQPVTAGQILLRLEDRHLKAALDRSQAELQTALKDLETDKMSIEQNRRRLEIEIERFTAMKKKAMGELDAQRSSLTRLQKQFERITSLVTQGAAATSELDKITGDRDRALGMLDADEATLEAADSNLSKAHNELDGLRIREARLAVFESQILIARSRVAAAEADLEAATVRAPDDGRVLERIVEIGGSAKVGEPLMSLWIGRPWIEAWADESDLKKFKTGSSADISFDAAPGQALAGRVESISLVTDKQLQAHTVPSSLRSFVRQNAMVPVRITLEGDASAVRLGAAAIVGIHKNAGIEEPNKPGLLGGLLSWTRPPAK